jgi:hypothetical protein
MQGKNEKSIQLGNFEIVDYNPIKQKIKRKRSNISKPIKLPFDSSLLQPGTDEEIILYV